MTFIGLYKMSDTWIVIFRFYYRGGGGGGGIIMDDMKYSLSIGITWFEKKPHVATSVLGTHTREPSIVWVFYFSNIPSNI